MKTCNERAPLSPGQTLVDVFPARAPRVLSGSEAFVATSQVRRLSFLLFLAGVVITGCGSTVDDQDAGPRCPAGEIFRFVDDSCGKASSAGSCGALATGCDSVDLTCGCDGNVYQSVCEAHQAGVDITFADQCAAPPDMFACGHAYCTRDTTFCHDFPEDSGGGAYCDSMPPECASAPSCACIQKSSSYDECEDDGMGGLHATEPPYTD